MKRKCYMVLFWVNFKFCAVEPVSIVLKIFRFPYSENWYNRSQPSVFTFSTLSSINPVHLCITFCQSVSDECPVRLLARHPQGVPFDIDPWCCRLHREERPTLMSVISNWLLSDWAWHAQSCIRCVNILSMREEQDAGQMTLLNDLTKR